ncbi:MAG: glycosyltransferase family 2 protein, partial [Elusimicrobiota bacterium]
MTTSPRPALSLVVPCWNEAESLPGLVERFAAALRRTDVEIILVDNGSTDRTAEVLAGITARRPFCRKVSLAANQGYGGGILAGLKAAGGAFLGWTHADLQTDPADALKGLELLESCPAPEKTLVKGLRTGRPLAARLFTWGMAGYASLALGTRLWDINGQPVLFHRALVGEWPGVMPSDFTFDLAALYAAK